MPPTPGSAPQDVPVSGEIRLGQFLKFAGLVDSGADAAGLIAGNDVLVDGVVETRRGRRLRGGEIIEVDTAEERVAARVVIDA